MIVKKINATMLLIYLIVFFVPYTTFRISGLKISEWLTFVLILIVLMRGRIRIKKKSVAIKFIVMFSLCITLSALISYIDPINKFKYGYDNGIFYSFEFGWVLKIFRLVIVGVFMIILSDNISDKKNFIGIVNTYIVSNIIVDLLIIIKGFGISGYTIGIDRTSAMAVEPSEAGFINCVAIIFEYYMLIGKQRKYRIYSFIKILVLVFGQLMIGSTASILSLGVAIAITTYLLLSDKKYFTVGSIFKKLLFVITFIGMALYLIFNTKIFDKVINYKYYLGVQKSSVAERLSSVTTCIRMFTCRPLFGMGFGNFGWYIDHFVTSKLYEYTPGGKFQPNNLYFQLLAELGILGIMLYMWLMICYFNKSKKCSSKVWYRYFLQCIIVYLLIHNITLPTIFSFQFWMFLAMVDSRIEEKL
ncbi:O-antigen ligase [Lachnospiraceae bacterium KH1T2]|nr:O-antigen ligase [Lachnospiraceae bacterium KH1T2]